MVPGLGFTLSARGTQSWLEPDHPSSLQPWKRPRLTPNPAIAFKQGKLLMPFGAPGGDAQCPAMLQMFLNMVEFGMEPQAAVEQPRFISWNFPNSFWPHEYLPGRLSVEDTVPEDTVRELGRRGHDIEVLSNAGAVTGSLKGVVVDHESGILKGAADPRREAYCMGW